MGILHRRDRLNGRPLINTGSGGTFNSFGLGDADAVGRVVGEIQGLPVVTDPNVPTNIQSTTSASTLEDVIIVTRASDLILFEDGAVPTQVTFEATGPAP